MKIITQAAMAFLLFSTFTKTQAQNIYGETIEVLEQRLQQDSSLYSGIGQRFLQGDSSLSAQELATLYYGHALRKEYNSVREDRLLDAANSLSRRGKYPEAMSLMENYLSKNPGSLTGWLERGYTAWMAEDSLQTVLNYQKYFALLDVPLKSGTGESYETAFVITSLRDMELVLDKLGYFIVGQSLLEKDKQNYKIVTAKKDDNKSIEKTFYFNVQLPVKRGMQQSLQQNKKK
jgi:tetratricopeptide (TPR) repeat protein